MTDINVPIPPASPSIHPNEAAELPPTPDFAPSKEQKIEVNDHPLLDPADLSQPDRTPVSTPGGDCPDDGEASAALVAFAALASAQDEAQPAAASVSRAASTGLDPEPLAEPPRGGKGLSAASRMYIRKLMEQDEDEDDEDTQSEMDEDEDDEDDEPIAAVDLDEEAVAAIELDEVAKLQRSIAVINQLKAGGADLAKLKPGNGRRPDCVEVELCRARKELRQLEANAVALAAMPGMAPSVAAVTAAIATLKEETIPSLTQELEGFASTPSGAMQEARRVVGEVLTHRSKLMSRKVSEEKDLGRIALKTQKLRAVLDAHLYDQQKRRDVLRATNRALSEVDSVLGTCEIAFAGTATLDAGTRHRLDVAFGRPEHKPRKPKAKKAKTTSE